MEKPRKSNVVGAYAVQCSECLKWRLIPTKDEYESIRENHMEEPWFCHMKSNVSCDDRADIEYSPKLLWAIDKSNIPKSPPGTERILTMRSDLSKMDVHYVMPNGKKVRSSVEVEKFLEAHPEYRGKFSIKKFSFTSPKVYEDLDPMNMEGNSSVKTKRLKTEN